MEKIHFGIVGGGWRAEFYLRIAKMLPHRFQAEGIVVRDPEKGRRIEEEYGTASYRSLDQLLEHRKNLLFVVLSVPSAVAPDYIRRLAAQGIPVLSETPPASDLESLVKLYEDTRGAKIQVAEQYPLQPRHQAYLKLIESGRLGEVSYAQVSVAHGYHGIALLRKLLGVGFGEARITARRQESTIVSGPNRAGPPVREELSVTAQEIVIFEFDGKLGLFDFTGDQYFSWIRSPRLLVRGTWGELADDTLRYLQTYNTPILTELRRVNAGENGNLEGYCLKGILCGEQWAYTNPFGNAGLSDDELAVAHCLWKMGGYALGGEGFYSLAEASQDQYLSGLAVQALESGSTAVSAVQPWAEERV